MDSLCNSATLALRQSVRERERLSYSSPFLAPLPQLLIHAGIICSSLLSRTCSQLPKRQARETTTGKEEQANPGSRHQRQEAIARIKAQTRTRKQADTRRPAHQLSLDYRSSAQESVAFCSRVRPHGLSRMRIKAAMNGDTRVNVSSPASTYASCTVTLNM